jgi:hypothetical protein
MTPAFINSFKHHALKDALKEVRGVRVEGDRPSLCPLPTPAHACLPAFLSLFIVIASCVHQGKSLLEAMQDRVQKLIDKGQGDKVRGVHKPY